ncbi:phosphate ABC transporter substrate-binding protein PstS [Actinotalea soli]|uniref:phosphate ABC transporter substrate-binding protein PstS n=1 Tax=Actinotalea soli TaxID=2819234 RepID=UPI0027DDB83C|nr:phosphate ABC transporter substrate-binding protein PstS [Actinotalea soli]
MNRTIRRATVPAALVLALGLAACGDASDDETTTDTGAEETSTGAELSGEIAGAGASSQGAAMEAWMVGFMDANPDANVTYDPIGSGGGREQFTSGGTDFAGSDAYLGDDEIAAAEETCGAEGFIEFAGYISPIAVAYNLPEVEQLNLSASALAQIFDGQITTWDDPAIAELNPDAELPDTNITAVHRSDESGTTENFVDYLAQAAPEDWPYEVSGDWPTQSGEAAPQTQGVRAALDGGVGTIGYIDASQVGDLGVAAIQVGDEFVEYSPEAAAAVVDAAEVAEGRPTYSFAFDLPRDTTESGVYPIVLVSYQLACLEYADQETADLVKGFLSYVISPEGQDAAAQNAGSAPISDELRTQAQEAIDAISVAG